MREAILCRGCSAGLPPMQLLLPDSRQTLVPRPETRDHLEYFQLTVAVDL